MSTEATPTYRADLRWSTHGVAHIRAEDWGSLGFGQGFACARDHVPTIVDQIVKVRSERSLFHGVGSGEANVASDFGYRVLGLTDRSAAMRDAQPSGVAAMITGYVAGLNAALRELEADDALPAWCNGAAWMRPVEELDFYAYLRDLAILASGRNLADIIGRAEAPGPDGPAPAAPISSFGRGGSPGEDDAPVASNGWAFGSSATASGHGLVMANPHFPWGGEARFWECHLTIPGEVDVYGVSLLGAPGVQIGFNDSLAWTHTFSRGSRFTLAKLDLVPGAPTTYRHGDTQREMTSADHTISVRRADGSVEERTRTFWATHHGPMVNLPLLGWGLETAFTYRDANLDNTAVTEQFLAMDQARTIEDLQGELPRLKAMPWANTLAADRSGRACYSDASATPNLSPAAQHRFTDRLRDAPMTALLWDNRVAMLDGSDPDDDWTVEPGARSDGLIPHDRLPQLERSDYLVNANDSHWLTHPADPLVGYSPLHGLERAPLSLRTRQNVRVAARLAESGDLTVAGLAIDAPLGEVPWAQRGEHRVPVHGGGEGEGVLNILAPIGALSSTTVEPGPVPLASIAERTGLSAGGYRCTYGTSFLMAVELTDDGPVGRGLLAYGQSGDPHSPHHADGTRAYTAKATRPLLFHDADIDADPNLIRRTIIG